MKTDKEKRMFVECEQYEATHKLRSIFTHPLENQFICVKPITIPEQGEVIRHVYNSIVFESNDGEQLALCMRDSGYEFKYEGVWYEAKNGKVNPLTQPPKDQEPEITEGEIEEMLFNIENDMVRADEDVTVMDVIKAQAKAITKKLKR